MTIATVCVILMGTEWQEQQIKDKSPLGLLIKIWLNKMNFAQQLMMACPLATTCGGRQAKNPTLYSIEHR